MRSGNIVEYDQSFTDCLNKLEQQVDDLEAEQDTHENWMDVLGMGSENANEKIADLEDSIDAISSCEYCQSSYGDGVSSQRSDRCHCSVGDDGQY